MTVIVKKDNSDLFYRNACIVMIWCIAVYSSIIQNAFFQIPYGILLFGGMILFFYIMANSGKSFDLHEALTEENTCIASFMIYMLLSGLIFSPNRSGHISQWITCMEYLFLQIVIASIIKSSGTDNFHTLLLAEAVVLFVVFIRNPVDYRGTGRYSISNDVNPNGLGMAFVAGIWAILYHQQKRKVPLILAGALVALFGYGIMLTGSRKSLIGTGLVIILWLFLCFLPSLKGKGSFIGIITFLVMIILVLIIGRGFSSMYANSKIASRMEGLLYGATEGSRSDMYRAGFEILKANPLFGTGFAGFQYYYGCYSHASLVEIPVSGGIIGASWYFCAYFISIRRIINIYTKTKEIQDLALESMRIKMVLILFVVMCFYTICIIHPYQFDSGVLFGIIFGETAYLENRVSSRQRMQVKKLMGSKYIRYE